MKYILGIAVFLTLTSGLLHKYYVSVNQVNYNGSKERLEVSLKVFNDDWQNALDRELGKPVLLGSKNQFSAIDSLIAQYVNSRYAIKVDGQIVNLSYFGSELEGDASYLYLLSDKVSGDFSRIEIYNAMLTDLFEEQRNIVQIKVRDINKSALFTKSRNKKEFDFK